MTNHHIVNERLKPLKKKLDYKEQIGKRQSPGLFDASHRLNSPQIDANQYDSSLNSLLNKPQSNACKSQKQEITPFRVNWLNPKGYVCKKQISTESKCFCTHPLKYHQLKQPKFTIVEQKQQLAAYCTVLGCICKHYLYIPAYGTYDFACICKHFYKDHDPRTKKCRKQRCIGCSQFSTSWTCDCGYRFNQHLTILSLEYQNKIPAQKFKITNRDEFIKEESINGQKQLFKVRMKIVKKGDSDIIKKKLYLIKVNQKFKQNASIALQMQYSLDHGAFPYEQREFKKNLVQKRMEKSPFELYLQQHHYQLINLSFLNRSGGIR